MYLPRAATNHGWAACVTRVRSGDPLELLSAGGVPLLAEIAHEERNGREGEKDVKYHAVLLVPCTCMMFTTRPQALSLQAKERMLGNYICVCDSINNTCTCSKVTAYFNVVAELRS